MVNQKRTKRSSSKQLHILLNETKDHDIIDFLAKQTVFNHTALTKLALRNLITSYGNVDLMSLFNNLGSNSSKSTLENALGNVKSKKHTNKEHHYNSKPKQKNNEETGRKQKKKSDSGFNKTAKPIPMDQLKFLDPDNLDDL